MIRFYLGAGRVARVKTIGVASVTATADPFVGIVVWVAYRGGRRRVLTIAMTSAARSRVIAVATFAEVVPHGYSPPLAEIHRTTGK